MKKTLSVIVGSLFSFICYSQTPEIWEDYISDKNNGLIPELNDYSYAGYHFSEKEIPDVNGWTQFNVVDFGAIADDDEFDDDAIQAAIDAAEEHAGPAVVFFPQGRFKVSDNNNTSEFIRISRDSIVLKGSGSGADGTEIFMKEMRVSNGHWQFRFEPENISSSSETVIAESVLRGEHSIIVEDASGLIVGETILISHKSQAFAEAHFGDLALSSQWTRLFGSDGGMRLFELHEIKAISGTRVTFVNPVQTDLPILESPYVINHYKTIQEIGVEDILFSSDWVEYPEDFVHHKDDIHDYAWNAMQFKHVKNGWIRNCELSSWNQGIDVRESIGFTITNVIISGKKGHASFLTRRGYGLLVKDCDDPAGQHHGPGTGYAGVNTVYLRHSMLEDISVDSHSGQPYATLMDDVDGGVMSQNGGPHESYPHHGQDFTFWNFRHKSTTEKTYDFWSIPRNGNTYAYPNFIGFQPNNTVTIIDEGINQMEGQMVSPQSLFEAQLALRLADTGPEISWLNPNYGDEVDISGDLTVEVDVTDNSNISTVVLYVNGVMQRELTSAPYSWGQDQELDPDLFNLDPDTYELKIEATDDEGNISTDAIIVNVGQAPTVDFIGPDDEDIIESGTPIVVEASATDSDGTISSVSLYLDDNLVSSIENPPYLWENESALATLTSGTYSLRLEAVDNHDLVSDVTHDLIVNDFPEVTFLTVNEGEQFEYEDNVRIDVGASDSDGDIEEVRLYLNGTLLRTEINFPYEWGKQQSLDPGLFLIKDGVYNVEAIAKDDLGSESSINISFTVNKKVLGLEDQAVEIEFYPNPFDQRLMINANVPIKNIQVFNTTGTLMSLKQKDTKSKRAFDMKTNHLQKGIYFIHVIYENDLKSIVKVIKR